jgi:hypothetical protein
MQLVPLLREAMSDPARVRGLGEAARASLVREGLTLDTMLGQYRALLVRAT